MVYKAEGRTDYMYTAGLVSGAMALFIDKKEVRGARFKRIG